MKSSGSIAITKTQKFSFSLNAWAMDFVLVICHTKVIKLFSSGRGLIKRVWPRQASL